MEQSESYRETLRDAGTAETLEREAHLIRSTGEKDAELAGLKQVVDENPQDAKAHQALGDFYYNSEHYAEAERAYCKAFEIDKRYSMREKMGTTRIRRLEQAEKAAQQGVVESGRAPIALAKAREARQKRLEFCIKEYRFRREQHPTDMKLAWTLGQFYFELSGDENIQNAIKQFQQAMSSSALKIRARYMLGRCFAMNPKFFDMAKEQFETALAEVETLESEMGKTITYELAQLDEKLGNEAEALVNYKKIFSVDAGFKDVAKKIQILG